MERGSPVVSSPVARSTPPPAARPSERTAPAPPLSAPVDAPKLTLQVLVYSEAPGQRMVFIDGRRYTEGDAIDAETVFAAAARGDEAAAGVLAELLDRLARGIAAAVVVLNPATVIVGGGLSRAGDQLLEPLERRIRELVPVPPRIALSTLGDEAVALGAARLALQAVDVRLFDLAATVPA